MADAGVTRWTEEQVAKQAPDGASLSAARGLARPEKWSETGGTDRLLWGSCQGSGKKPYQVSIDLSGPAYKCSCPSRKFPCKHGLALLLMWATGGVEATEQVGDFAREWLEQRREREVRKAAPKKDADPRAQAKRLADRLTLMDAGIEDLARWLGDLARTGLASARARPTGYWDNTAARLVDAQLPGLAESVAEAGSLIHRRPDWAEYLLDTVGMWWTTVRAWQRRDELSDEEFADLRSALGWAWPGEEIRAADQITDRWTILGAHHTDDGRLRGRRTWLHGTDSGETVLFLDFAAGTAALPIARLAGSTLEVALSRYPGHPPRRALLAGEPRTGADINRLPEAGSIDDALDREAGAAALNPWTPRVPVTLSDIVIMEDRVVDATGQALPLAPDAPVWQLHALTGGHPVTLFGELERTALRPLTVLVDGELIAL